MKPFNLEAALAGAPVVTRNGTPVTELTCFKVKPPATCLRGVLGGEIYGWDSRGVSSGSSILDLFMAPVKKKGWMVIKPYIPSNGAPQLGYAALTSHIYDTQLKADVVCPLDGKVIPVEWEE